MSSLKLREKIIDKLNDVNDELLRKVLNLIEFETNKGIYALSDDQKKDINKAKQEISEGNYFTNEDVKKDIEEWLNE